MRQIKRCVPKNMTMFTLRKEPCAFKITLCDYGQNGNSQRGIAFWQYPFDCLIASAVCATQAPTPDPLRTAFPPPSPALSPVAHSRYRMPCRGRSRWGIYSGRTDSSISWSYRLHPLQAAQKALLLRLFRCENAALADAKSAHRGAEHTDVSVVA